MRRFNYVETLVMLTTVLQWVILATLTGTIVGTGTSMFLHALHYSTALTDDVSMTQQMLLLVFGGIANGLLLHYGYKLNRTGLKDSSIAAVHAQDGRMPFKTMLIKPVAAIITLASGGSAGKEGPCSHIGGTLASGIAKGLSLNAELSKRLVACGVSAGFASVFGTPIAGAIYGVEVLAIGRIRHDFLFPAIIAGVASFEISKVWGVPYEYYQIHALPEFSEIVFLKTISIGIMCGIAALIFVDAISLSSSGFARLRDRYAIWPPLMPVIGSVVLCILIVFIPTDYLGLSIHLMDEALGGTAMPHLGFLWKALLVAITLGSGFYGGIVTPQFVIGALVGSAFAPLLGIHPSLGAAVGLVSVVAAASNTPIAAIMMGVELFGGVTGTVYVAGASIAAYLVIGHRSVYPDQLIAYPKSPWMHVRSEIPLGEEKIRLSFGLLKTLSRYRIGRQLERLWRRRR
jgi:H+/Cl- antiporter ClcA